MNQFNSDWLGGETPFLASEDRFGVNRYRIALSATCPFVTQSLTKEQTSPVDVLCEHRKLPLLLRERFGAISRFATLMEPFGLADR
jgi:hypothetical protein